MVIENSWSSGKVRDDFRDTESWSTKSLFNIPRFNIFKKENSYQRLETDSSEDKTKINDEDKEIYRSFPKPEKCDRCLLDPPKIRVLDHKNGYIEFICKSCLSKDKKLKNIPIKKKSK